MSKKKPTRRLSRVRKRGAAAKSEPATWTLDQVHEGQTYRFQTTLSDADVDLFAPLTGYTLQRHPPGTAISVAKQMFGLPGGELDEFKLFGLTGVPEDSAFLHDGSMHYLADAPRRPCRVNCCLNWANLTDPIE
jgi:hypothetical protein